MLQSFGFTQERIDSFLQWAGVMFAGSSLIMGIMFLCMTKERAEKVAAYDLMRNLFHINVWGWLFVIAAVLMAGGVISIAYCGYADDYRPYIIVTLAGALGVFVWVLYGLAAVDGATSSNDISAMTNSQDNSTTVFAYRHLWAGVWHLIYTILGCGMLCQIVQTKKKPNQ